MDGGRAAAQEYWESGDAAAARFPVGNATDAGCGTVIFTINAFIFKYWNDD